MPVVFYGKTGVYLIRNTINGKVYVGSGSTKRGIQRRITDHKKALRDGRHINRYLQRAWDKYGEEAFEFRVLERCSSSRCLEREQFWLDRYQAANPLYGYNICPKAGNTLGITFTEETKQKIREKTLGRKWSEESKKKLSATLKGHAVSQKALEAMNWSGRKHKGITKLKMSMYASNRSLEHRIKLSLAARAKRLTAEHKKRISEGLRRHHYGTPDLQPEL